MGKKKFCRGHGPPKPLCGSALGSISQKKKKKKKKEERRSRRSIDEVS